MSLLQTLIAAKLSGSGGGGGGGGSVTVDAALSASSENPVQNKVINAALATKGTYSKPASGIPKSDLSNDVQTSLLPVVSESDNGKFLRVASGAWTAATVPSAETASF